MKTKKRIEFAPVALLAAMLVPALPQAAVAENNTCFQKGYTIEGTNGKDRLVGTPKADVIQGLGGNDVIKGLGGNDRLCGGRGKDRIIGGDGTNSIKGEEGHDLLVGGPSDDWIRGGEADDRIEARGGDDETDGEEGEDQTFAGAGNDTLSDQTRFQDYDDSLMDGGPGDDLISAGSHDCCDLSGYIHKVVGGPGNDKVDYDSLNIFLGGPGNDYTDPDTEQEFARLSLARGGSGNDVLYGRDLYGGRGDDSLSPWVDQAANFFGGPGNDTLRGFESNDVLRGGAGSDELIAEGNHEGTDQLFGQEGDDVLNATDGADDDVVDGGPHVVGDTCTSDPEDTKVDCEI